MITSGVNSAGVANVLAQIRQYQAQVQAKSQQVPMPVPQPPVQVAEKFNLPVGPAEGAFAKQGVQKPPFVLEQLQNNDLREALPKPAFGDVVRGSLQSVNDLQQASAAMRTAYEKGENIPLTDVVLGMQKASLAFEATLQIRNKVMKAYEEIMNMPV
ncbi:MAG: Flagellar hook-basal body complex protein FliE [Pseudomonadota bacterium]|jgi:flagellar hook-basal body complex protein FliE